MSERFQGGAAVPGGYYLNAARWAVEPIARDGDRLPPGPGEWRRVPMLVALALVPILGVSFIMFMPTVGFLVLGGHVVRKIAGLFAPRAAAPDEAAPEQDAPTAPDDGPAG